MKMNKYRGFRNKDGLQYRLLKYFSAFAIIPIVVLSIAITGFLLNGMIKRINENAKLSFDGAFRIYDGMLEDTYQIGNTVSQDSNVRAALEERFSQEEDRYYRELIVNSHLFHMLKYSNKSIKAYVLGENGVRFKSSDRTLKEVDFRKAPWYIKTEQLNQPLWTNPHIASNITNSLDVHHIALTIPIRKSVRENLLGMVYMDVEFDESLLMMSIEKSGYFYIINQEDTTIISEPKFSNKKAYTLNDMVLSSRESIKYWDIQRSNESFIIEDSRMITIFRKSNINDWIYCSVISKKIIYKDIIQIIFTTIGIILILIFVSFYVSTAVSDTLINPLVTLTSTMEKVQGGDFTARAESGTSGEIGQLEVSFNFMVEDINHLMNQVVEEQEKTRQYEIMLLQAQIKPHFLYNTFDSAIWLIRIGEYDDAMRMLQELTIFLRSGLNKGKDVIDLKQELSNMVSYLEIQLLRYKKKLSYEVDIPDKLLTIQLPKLILQPLVENALYHGIKGKESGGMIYVYGYENDEETVIAVSDDGIGMTKEAVEQLMNSRDSTRDSEIISSYGFKNVYERLYMFFKERLTLEIDSEIGIGTTVKIRIKKEAGNV